MFDISFLELLVIAVVALVVLGPDRLPDAIRTSALWIGRAKRSFNKAKAEIEQQLNTDEIRRQLHNESILSDIEEARRKAEELIKDTRQELDSSRDSIREVVDSGKDIPAITNSAKEGLPTGPAGSGSTSVAHGDESKGTENTEIAESAERTERAERTESPASGESAVDQSQPASGASEPEDAPTATKGTAPQPIQDFYNSPPQGRVRLDGGKYYTVDEPAPVNEQPASDEKAAPPDHQPSASDTTPAKRRSDEH